MNGTVSGIDSASSLERGGAGDASPIDFVFLRRYTLGDAELEREVLGLFCSRAAIDLEALKAAQTEKAWREAAHALKGSALSLGAWKVARCAERAEAADMRYDPAVVASLEAAIDDVRRCLAALGIG